MGVGFYGGGGGGGSSVPSVTDYNNLNNIPIINLIGSSQEYFVNLAGLNYGIYNLKGYYKEDGLGQVLNTINPIELKVVQDEETNQKICMYQTIRNEQQIIHFLIYDNNSILIEHKEKFPNKSQLYWEE